MTIYDLKPAFQNMLRPICRWLAGVGVTANQVTIAALTISIGLGVVLAIFPASRWAYLLIPAWLFLRMALNAIDGMLAREHGMQSKLGAILNELSDVVADAALYLPFALVPGFSPILVIIAVVLSVVVEMAGVVAVQIGASRRYDGPMGKSDRAFVFGLIALLLGAGLQPGAWANVMVAITAMLSAMTILNRSSMALAELDARNRSQSE